MRPRLRWYWAAPIAFVVWFVLSVFWVWLTLDGPLDPVMAWLIPFSSKPTDFYIYVVFVLWVFAPTFLVGLGVYAGLWRGRPPDQEYLRCLKCGYILKGLSEPRCPECGEHI